MSTEALSDKEVKPGATVTTGDVDEGGVRLCPSPVDNEPPPRRMPVRSATMYNQGIQYASPQEQKYPPDRPGEAAGDNGRVWKIYRDRVEKVDDDLLEGWNDTLNMLLVFAGLFSAACTAFLIEVSKNLQPDWQQATSLAVFAIYVHLNSTGSAPFEVPNPLAFTAPTNVRWINGLWFTSLTLSLAVSLLAILAKQWLNEFKSRMRAPHSSPKMWAMRHSAYKGGLERWGMDAFISTLPLLLHAALFLFLMGLCLLLMPLDDYIVGVVIGLTVVLGTFYIVSGLAPVFWGVCPSATPMLRYFYSFWSKIIVPAFRVTGWMALSAYSALIIALAVFSLGLVFLFDLIIAILTCCTIWQRYFSLADLFNDYVIDPVTRFLLPAELGDSPSFPAFPSSRMDAAPIYAILRYRARAALAPAFDQDKVLSSDEPLREASILAWMIRSLPAEEDIQVALCAAGWLSFGAHMDYFQTQKLDSPLIHADLRRAAVDALNNIATRVDAIDDATTASIIRACLFVAEGPFELIESTRKFLSQCMDKHVHDLHLLSYAACHGGGASASATPIPFADIRSKPVELITLSRLRGMPCPHGITRMIINAPTIPLLPYSEDVVSTLESDMLHDQRCREAGWKPRVGDDHRLRFLSAVDAGLRHSDSSKLYDWERSTISNLYGAAARDIVSDTTVELPRDFHDQMRWIATDDFRDYELSIDDLNAVATLLLRVTPDGRGCIPPVLIYNLLDHIERRFLPVSTEAMAWVLESFRLPSDTTQLVHGLRQYPYAKAALSNSHLSLLQPVVVSPELSRSPWSQLRGIVPLECTAKELGEIVYGYTVLLLVLHRRGYRETAQALLHELLPYDWAASLIALNIDGRYHFTLHGGLISQTWYEVVASRLLQPSPPQPWVGCGTYPDAAAFVEALRPNNDCSACAHDDIRIKWGIAPVGPGGNAPETELSVRDAAVWDPPPATPINEARWRMVLTRAARTILRTREPLDGPSSLGQPDGVLERGLRPAADVGRAFVG